MRARVDRSLPLHGWTMLSLRPRGQHGGLRAAASRTGARLLAVSTLAIEPRDDASTRTALREALASDIVVFTSPNAVRSAAALLALAPRRNQQVLAVGDGTRNALRRLGIDAQVPVRMDSEGLLALPALGEVAGLGIGLVTGAGGRNLLAPALQRRGAVVARADTYCRVRVPFSARVQQRLFEALSTPQRVVLVLSSTDAFAALSATVSPAVVDQLRAAAVVAASARLAQVAGDAGFHRIAIAASARPADLLRAAANAFV